jgi:class 3 adenylate cyclase
MICPRCQAQNRDGVRFCEHCGASFAETCPKCAAVIAPGAAFCGACGVAFNAAPADRFASPGAYTPPHLAERILTSRAALEGERKQVTVLFADLKGSMELLADRDPEDARHILDQVLEHMMDAVHRYEGTVNQVMGDGIMALFGAPLAHEDHAVRACYAALRMQEAVHGYSESLRRSRGIEVRIRVGLNSGEVVVRSIGSDLHMDYTAVGRTTQLAARMEQLASPGTIRLTAETLRLVEGYVEVKPLGPIPVKGLTEPVDAFEMIDATSVQTRLRARAQRGLTRFVGREPELAQLHRALERARAGHGQIVAIVGEPGVGKSRLFYEFMHSPSAQDWLVLESTSVSYGRATPYLPVIGLLKAYFQIEARDDARTIRERVTGKLLALDRALEPALTPLQALLDALGEDAQWQALDPSQRRRLTLDAVKRFLLRESRSQPLLLFFDDLHWVDSETQALLDGLVETLPTARILLLAGYRPEYQHAWGNKSYYTQLRIDPLAAAGAESLLSALLGAEARLGPLKRLLIERTEGNPFFLEESVRTLVETNGLTGERGAYGLARDLRTIQMPVTIQAVLAARIDRLPAVEKRLLQSAAVVGKDVPFAILQAIADLDESSLRQSLANLQAAEFLHETRLFPDLEYAFRHALTHEVAYGGLLQKRRQALHGRIVDALERLYAGRDTEQVELLAHHALRGEAWPRAVGYLRRAGARAASRSAHRQAVAYFEQAQEIIQHLPEGRETIELAADLRFDLRNSLHPVGDLAPILGHLSEAEKLAGVLGDRRRLAWVFSFMCQYFRLVGNLDRAIESGQRALAIADALGDIPLWIAVGTHLGPAHGATGDFRKATAILTKVVDALRENPNREDMGSAGLLSVFSRIYLVYNLAERGEFREAMACGEEGIRLAVTADHQYSLTFAYCGVGTLFLVKGDLESAIRLLERGLQLCRSLNLPLMLPLLASPLGSAYALSGRYAEAIPLLEEAVSQAVSMERMGELSSLVARLGEAYLLAGRLDDAGQSARRALELARAQKERGREAYALRLAGEVGSRGAVPNLDEAEAAYREALALAEELGMRPLLAQCHLGLGRLYRRARRREDAEQHLAAAIGSFRSLDMPQWLEKAESERQSLA